MEPCPPAPHKFVHSNNHLLAGFDVPKLCDGDNHRLLLYVPGFHLLPTPRPSFRVFSLELPSMEPPPSISRAFDSNQLPIHHRRLSSESSANLHCLHPLRDLKQQRYAVAGLFSYPPSPGSARIVSSSPSASPMGWTLSASSASSSDTGSSSSAAASMSCASSVPI